MKIIKLLLSALLLTIFIYYQFYEIIVFEILILLSLYYLPRLVGKMNDVVRSVLFFLPYLLPIFYFKENIFSNFTNEWTIFFFGLIVVSLIQLSKIQEYQIMFDPSLIKIMQPITLNNFLYRLLESYGSAISEEIFYRGFILIILMYYVSPLYAILICSSLFVVNHLYNRHIESRFSYKNILMIFGLSLLLSSVFYYSHNIYYSIILHIIYNTPQVIYNFILYRKGKV